MPTKISFYIVTVFFAFACGILAAMVAYRHRGKFNELKYFYIYPLASFTQMALFFVLIILRVEQKVLDNINFTAQCIFLLIEFLAINHFFLQVLKSQEIIRLLKASRLLYFVILLFYWVVGLNYFFTPAIGIFVFQAIFILFPALIYFFELFKTPVTVNPFSDFSFWISAGTLFYFSCTLPVCLFSHYTVDKNGVFNESTLSSINYICYGVLFLFIIKAFLCPQKPTM